LAESAKRNLIFDTGLRYNPFYYKGVKLLIRDFERMDFDERRASSDRLLSRSLRWARDTVAYRDFDQPFSQWPVTEKEALRGNEKKFRKRTALSVVAATGGSTGIPIRLWRSPRCIAAEQAFIDSLLENFGFTFRNARIAMLRADPIKSPSDRDPPFGITTNWGSRLLLSASHVSADTAYWYANAINQFAPDILWVYPSSAESLARHFRNQGLDVHVPVVLSSSEVLHESSRRLISQVFHAKAIAYYGLAERVAFATTTEDGQCRFSPAYGLIELRRVADLSSDPDYMYAEIVATGFWNESMPLIRYRTGDYVLCPASYVEKDLEAVALGIKPFVSVAGRETDYLISPRGEILIGMNHIPWNTTNIIRIQLIQESPYFVRINVISTPEFGEANRKVLAENARLMLPEDMKVESNLVEELEVSPSGKTPYIIRRFDLSQSLERQG